MDTATPDPHASRGHGDVIASFVSLGIAFIILVIRLTTRATVVRNLGPEDYVIILSFIFSVTLSALIFVEYKDGMSRHIATISKDEITALFKAMWASIPVYHMALTLTKLSILLQYQQLFFHTKIRNYIIALFAITSVYGAWSILGNIFMCSPVRLFWTMGIPREHCMDKYAVWYANASLNIVTDIAIFILPMPVLNELHLPKVQRAALIVVFGLGAFVCLTSILRLRALYMVSLATDFTWASGGAAAWSSLEVNVGIICASLPTLRATLNYFWPTVFLSSSELPYYGGSKRFPTAQEAANWAEILPTPEYYGKSTAQVVLDRKIDAASLADSCISEAEAGAIRVLTVTTQVVQFSDPKKHSTASARDSKEPCGTQREVYELDTL